MMNQLLNSGSTPSLADHIAVLKKRQSQQRAKLEESINHISNNCCPPDGFGSTQCLEGASNSTDKENWQPETAVLPLHSSGTSACGIEKGKLGISSTGTSPVTNASECSNSKQAKHDVDSNKSNQVFDTPKIKFPYLKRGEGTKRFNFVPRKLKLNSKRMSSGASNNGSPSAMPLQELKLDYNVKTRGPNVNKMHHTGRPNYNNKVYETDELFAFEKLEELTEHASFCSSASIVDNLFTRPPAADRRPSTVCDFSPIVASPVLMSDKASIGGAVRATDGGKKDKVVQFSECGAQVLEYLTNEEEFPTMSDTSTLLNVSDLEELGKMYLGHPATAVEQYSVPVLFRNIAEARTMSTSTPDKALKNVNSHILKWKSASGHCDAEHQESNCLVQKHSAAIGGNNAKMTLEKEVEAQKVVLVSKVHELEKEIKTFQSENAQLKKYKEVLQKEKLQFEKEKQELQLALEEERVRNQQYLEEEINKLHVVKNSLKSKASNLIGDTAATLEIINLKEEILRLKQETSERESKNNILHKKLKSRIHELEAQNQEMTTMTNKYSDLKKENIELKHQLDRLRLASKTNNNKKKNVNGSSCHNLQAVQSTSTAGSDARILNVITSDKIISGVNNNAGNNLSPADSRALSVSCDGQKKDNSGKLPSEYVSFIADDGSTVFRYNNGNIKKILRTGVEVYEYYNGDKKEVFYDKVVYTYGSDGTVHTVRNDGVEELEYSYGQKEITESDGTVTVLYPDKTKKCIKKDGTEVFYNHDGTVVHSLINGEKILELSSGQLEYHGHNYKKREYPDGTTKIIFSDGRTETIFPDGKVKVKNVSK